MENKKNNYMAFDIGFHHFAFAKMDSRLQVIAMDCKDFGHHSHLMELYPRLLAYLQQLNYENVTTILVEQQMNRMNIKATKISVFVLSYFLICHPHIQLVEYPSFQKTKKFGMKGLSKAQRKKWTVQYVKESVLLDDPIAMDWLETFKKKDDICDCIMMILAFLK